MTCTAAILAGGQATRFEGRNKAALRFGEAAILERQLAVLRRVVDRVVIVANDATPYESYGVPVVPDVLPGAGALGAVYTAVVSASAPYTLVVGCDMPFLGEPFLAHLIDAGRSADIAIPRTAHGYEPLCATYSRRCAAVLRRQIEAKHFKVTDVLASEHGLSVREIGPDETDRYGRNELLFFNINTAEDYARAIDLDHEARGGF